MKNLQVSIGIPAYNEEANIKNLLQNLLQQEGDNFELLEIIVMSDGSTDQTANVAKSVTDRRIIVKEYLERLGKPFRQNELLGLFAGDVLIILDADVISANNEFISKITSPFIRNPRIGLVGGKVSPIEPRTFFEKIMNFSAILKQDIYEKLNQGNNIYLCHGRVRAFSRDFASQLNWPKDIGSEEDAYSYLISIERGFDFSYQPEAEIFFRSPQAFRDYIKQSSRFMRSKKQLGKYFTNEKITANFFISFNLLLRTTLKFFIRHPILFVSCLGIFLASRLAPKNKKYTALWEPSETTKNLNQIREE
ncbi:MAG: putative glycosyltransferase [Parcubacteria group bacterium Gr01-1014_24]|nr:MAG: putative glycosyltransferase [Parcubacteria group bacterium Gr01-1014_24]